MGSLIARAYGPLLLLRRRQPRLHFTDVSSSDSFCRHVHYLWAKGIVSGCAATLYCVSGEVSRGEMAGFLSNAFAPNLYGP